MQHFHYSPNGLAMTKSFEGLRLTAYRDTAGVLTIGYGHTGADVHANMTITEPEAEALLLADLAEATACVNRAVTLPLTQNQFDALVDFCFNSGRSALLHSTLLRELNAGNPTAAAAQFAAWVYAGGKITPGLVRPHHNCHLGPERSRRKRSAPAFAMYPHNCHLDRSITLLSL